MRADSATTSRRSGALRLHGRLGAVRLVSCFLSIALSGAFVTHINQGVLGANLLWVANGVLLAYMLVAPRWRWPVYLVIGFAALMAGDVLSGGQLNMRGVLFAVLNLGEVVVGALLLRRRSSALPCFTSGTYLVRFIAYAVVAGPLAIGLIYTLLMALSGQATSWKVLLSWAGADGMGIAVTTPAVVAILRSHIRSGVSRKQYWVYPAVLVAVTIAAFWQASIPLVFLIYPILILILLRMGMGWSALSLLFVAVVAGSLTILGRGPFAELRSISHTDSSVLLQLFVATGMFILYSVSVVLEKQRTTERRLRQIAALHALVTENSRDVIILADFDGHRTYVSAATQSMGGWDPDDLVKQGSFDLVHPDDRAKTEAVVHELRSGGQGAMIECRVKRRDGVYLWVEASLRVVQDPETGVPSGLLNIVRDISERKIAEKRLQDAYHAVEALAITDALTGLANRRRFDQCLASEWRRALRDHNPLSMLLIDVDLFKSYNDTYGHLRGDSCLKQIAEAAQDVVTRPGDLVTRFGGEEFAIILPNTENPGAMLIAHEICAALRRRNLPHDGNPTGIMTASVGCATFVPKLGQHATDLIESADKALYKAKRNGRNQVCNGNAMQDIEVESRTSALQGPPTGEIPKRSRS